MKHGWYSAAQLGGLWSAQVINHRAALRSLAMQETITLGQLCRIESGQYVDTYVSEGYPDAGACPYLRVDNIRPFVANLSRADLVWVRRDHPAVQVRSRLQEADVIIARTGTLGKAALAVGELVGAVMSQHITRLTIRPELWDRVSPEVLCAFLNSPAGRAQLLAGSAGSTRRELTHERLASLHVPIIAAELQGSLARPLRAGSEQLAEAGAFLRKAVALYEAALLLPGQPRTTLPRYQWAPAGKVRTQWSPRYHCLPGEPLVKSLPVDYDMVPLGSVASITRGKGTRTTDYAPSGIPFVRTTSLINGGIDPFPDHYASPETCARFGQQVQEGDLLLSIEGKIGAVAYLTDLDDCVFKNHIERIRPQHPALAPDLYLALASEVGQAQMRRLTVYQATLPGLASRSRQLLIPLSGQDGHKREDSHPALVQARQCLQTGLRLRRAGLHRLRAAVSVAAGLFASDRP